MVEKLPDSPDRVVAS